MRANKYFESRDLQKWDLQLGTAKGDLDLPARMDMLDGPGLPCCLIS